MDRREGGRAEGREVVAGTLPGGSGGSGGNGGNGGNAEGPAVIPSAARDLLAGVRYRWRRSLAALGMTYLRLGRLSAFPPFRLSAFPPFRLSAFPPFRLSAYFPLCPVPPSLPRSAIATSGCSSWDSSSPCAAPGFRRWRRGGWCCT